ncbi:DUF3427 domain-containing protein [Xylanimonas sp. McL0601]|uniref:DUF3427 domain-containing protein n=1 Tax=Xylanimonas sp. McL0601 TaxID=3414739 RepID=UPI003CED4CEF
MNEEWAEFGLREDVVTTELDEALAQLSDLTIKLEKVDDADLPHLLARHIYDSALRSFARADDAASALALGNRVLSLLGEPQRAVASPPRQLLRLVPAAGPGVITYDDVRPTTPLGDAALLTNAKSEPNLGPEIKAEIATSDHVDLLCAFVRWAGLRLLEPELRRLAERGGRLRVITTTYTGATERKALDKLVREYGADVRIQYDALRTRLHAKAWMFHRNTGFDTAYVGSSNLTHTAMLDGVEWNVRLSRVAMGSLLDKFDATFDTYWNDASFQPYNPDIDSDRLDRALAEAGGGPGRDRVTISLAGLDVRAYPYQQEMLDELEAERVLHDRHRNLLVAATGTGKTVVAALDYRRLCEQAGGARPRLLFVAHRKEILTQSLRTYREVLADANFGELYVGGVAPTAWTHVFASVQSLSSYGVARFPVDAFEVIVIDEFHHAAARTYRAILNHLRPRELVGLTATPERADGTNVAQEFFGGRIASELRLWDALDADLLCPFHYFAVSDGTDLSAVTWRAGRYDDTELSNLFTGNEARARIILRELRDKVLDPGTMRALGFCASVAHASYMARTFNEAGIPAALVTGETLARDRAAAITALGEGRVNVIFTVDVFNEGLDIPSVDTVLFLRPTESATIFLQQLGRGLRRTATKAVLTVLDFVGLQNSRFRWDIKLGALTGIGRGRLQAAVQSDFPFLPSGSQIAMDKVARDMILDNLRSQIGGRWRDLLNELRRVPDADLGGFLDESGAELADVLKPGRSWTRLRREVGLEVSTPGPRENEILKRVRNFAHVDDAVRAHGYQRVLRDNARWDDLSPVERELATMLLFSIWPDAGKNSGRFPSFGAGLAALRLEIGARAELSSVVDLAFDSARRPTFALDGSLSGIPLQVHARYRREEILAALRWARLDRLPTSFREGVVYSQEFNADAFFIQLKKSDKAFSPTTLYRDYPISPTLFHWESQSRTTVASPTGQRYLNGSSSILLFARETDVDDFGSGAPFLFLGPATYVSHHGERPIAITWLLKHAMPTDFFTMARVAAA